MKHAYSRRANSGLSSQANFITQMIGSEDQILIRLERWKAKEDEEFPE